MPTRLFAMLKKPFAMALLLAGLLPAVPAGAQQQVGNVSGLPLPRFVTVSAAPVNVRVGPGTNYEIAWTFLKPRIPVEIIQEFDTWRQIRAIEGDTGWVHQSLVTGERTALIEPESGDQTPLLANPNPESAVRAWLGRDLQVSLRGCNGSYCEASLSHTGEDGRSASYRGFVAQGDLWGAYPGEVFD